MKTATYTVRFLTPAFLGNAAQDAQWRTPPFKALLRQWWRVAYAAEHQFAIRIDDMRRAEALLFGHAWLKDDTFTRNGKTEETNGRKSQVRLRLSDWGMGNQRGVAPLSTGLDTSYAWFGLIKRGNGLADRNAIKAEANSKEAACQLTLAFPEDNAARLSEVMQLIHNFGLLGSRSRGGWGALHIDKMSPFSANEAACYARDLAKCLEGDWAMSLAKDDKGLCTWDSNITFTSWDKAMKFIATHRKAVRTSLDKCLRPALGFALSNGRMPSPLRWKVMAAQPGKLTVRIFALPHRLPDDSGKKLSQQELQSAWHTVFQTLDSTRELHRWKQGK